MDAEAKLKELQAALVGKTVVRVTHGIDGFLVYLDDGTVVWWRA